MNKRTLYFLSICLLFVFCIVKADVLSEPNIMKINGIFVYENVVNKILDDARSKSICLDILDAKDKSIKVKKITKGADVIINGNKPVEEMVKLYNEIMSGRNTTLIHKTSEDDKITVYVDKKKGIVTDVLIEN